MDELKEDLLLVKFGSMTAQLWERMVPQPKQDKYREAMWRARVWLNQQRRKTK